MPKSQVPLTKTFKFRILFLGLVGWLLPLITLILGVGLFSRNLKQDFDVSLKHIKAREGLRLAQQQQELVSSQMRQKALDVAQELSFYLLTENGRDFKAMSNICTHLGCRVRWVEDQSQFLCPCHNGVFSKDGNVVAGPPPRSLDVYQAKVEDDQIYVLGG